MMVLDKYKVEIDEIDECCWRQGLVIMNWQHLVRTVRQGGAGVGR
jgi:hypothetical protein